MSGTSLPIGILGAGLSGLTVAWSLQKSGTAYQLLEGNAEPGGYIRSVREGEYLRELGPNSLLIDQEVRAFLHELDLSSQLLPANPVGDDRYVFRNGAYRQLPSGPLSLLFGGFFGWKTKLAVLRESRVASRSPEGETLAAFFARRFSPELVDYALNPFVAGIYAGDPQQLLVAQTFPALVAYEREHGSVLKGLMKNRTGERRQSVSFRDGLQTLPRVMASKLDGIRFGIDVQSIHKNPDSGWRVVTSAGELEFDKLIVTAPAFVCAGWFRESLPAFSQVLEAIRYPPMTVVHTAFRRADVRHPLQGFGGLNPKIEGLFAAGHLWSSSVFAARCPPDEVLLTSFVGGSQSANRAHLPDEALLRQLNAELQRVFGVTGEPTFQRIFRWERAIPQYDAHALPAQQQAAALEKEGLFFCTNWLNGVSLTDAIKKGRTLAEKLQSLR
ncbi:MAG: protoporphyrinogen oxidase [Cytophagaceae bacterium]|nr:protoporphyrinogen oxidase [Cytophagaceae bacterium]